jgi:apolipoprotein N-acyltransferase
MDAGFPDRGWWPLTFVGIALVLVALVGRSVEGSLLVGFVAGLAFYLVHIEWASLFLGPLPMAALSVLQSLFFALGAMAIALAYRWLPHYLSGRAWNLVGVPAVVAGLWTAREGIASVWPYGGFAWGRVALSQSESPISDLFPWIGVSGVSFVMVFLVSVVIASVRFAGVRPATRAAVATAIAALVIAVPLFPTAADGSIRVAAVQGNGRAGYFDTREFGDLLAAQYDATRALEGESADVVLWPEGGTDISPIDDGYAERVFDSVSEQFDAPLISGMITYDDDLIYNSSVVWMAGEGVQDEYNKRHPVPFGEYIPDRAFWRPFAPDLIDLVQREYTPGTTDAVFDLGNVMVGVNICFDIVDDRLMRETVEDGAQVIFAQTNNADFGRTDESVQQLAIARVRALELGRTVVNISTVGTSAIILADGSTLDQLEWYTVGAMVTDVPTSSVITPAARIGASLEGLLGWLSLAVLAVAGISAATRRRGA